ncbi:MAG: hypothetical protein M5U12_26605 [Verrucomicrobia bacterium]|nr:hypothetical protein [Verrucomicrobiota bacterium]
MLEQARFLDELKGTGGLSLAEIAQQVGRSPAWVSLRLGVLAELSPLVCGALFDGTFPVYSYLYTLRPFRRLNGAAAIDEFVAALRGKNSVPGKSSSWRTGFSAARSRCGSRSAKGIWPCRCNNSRSCPRIRTGAASLNAGGRGSGAGPEDPGPPHDQERRFQPALQPSVSRPSPFAVRRVIVPVAGLHQNHPKLHDHCG